MEFQETKQGIPECGKNGGDHIEFKDRLACLNKLGHFFGIPRAPFLLSWCRDECAFEILLKWITTMKSRWWTDCLLDGYFNPCKRKRQGHGRHRNFQLNCKKKQFLHWAEIWRRNYHITIVIHASLKVGSHLAASHNSIWFLWASKNCS